MKRIIIERLLGALIVGLWMAVPTVLLADTSAPINEPESQAHPVTGAFGIPLGERFKPAMVARVISESDKTYRGPGNAEINGTLYEVEPTAPDDHFRVYSVATTADGRIYAIRAEYRSPDKASRCAVTKEIATALEEKHGKPRGKGFSGAWYAFRDMSVDHYRGIRLYANRCDQGIYEIIYSDDSVRQAKPSAPATDDESGP
jgi:hypothetical protein